MDGISDKINQNPSFLEDEFAEILTPLIICRRFCVITTILSSIYLIGIYAGFTSFYFLIFYPIFFSIITTLQTMSFVRNRLFIQTQIFYYCCYKPPNQSKHDDNDDDNHIFYENDQDSNITPNPPNTIFQMQPTEDSIHTKDNETNNIKIEISQIDDNTTNESNHNYKISLTDTYNNDNETDNESKTTVHHGLDMSPIAENIEADINSVVDIEVLMVQQISGGGLVGMTDNGCDSESEEVSSLLFAKPSIRSPNSISTSRRDDMKTINEEHEVIDFSGVIASPTSMARFLSSPNNFKCPPPGNNSRQHSTRDSGKIDDITIGAIDQLLNGNSKSLDIGNDDKEERVSGNETDNDGNNEQKSRVKHNRIKNKNSKHSKSKGKAGKEYKLETDDLLLTLRMLVNDGLVEEKSASHVKSLRIRQQRLRNTVKKKGRKAEEEISFLLSENSKRKSTDSAMNKSKEKSVPFEE